MVQAKTKKSIRLSKQTKKVKRTLNTYKNDFLTPCMKFRSGGSGQERASGTEGGGGTRRSPTPLSTARVVR